MERSRFFLGLGGSFLAATPDTEYTAKALQGCRVTAHVSTKLNRAHLITGEIALILPCLGRSEIDRQAGGEQFVTVEDSMGVISSSRGHLEPASEQLLSEPAIVARLARATHRRRHDSGLGSGSPRITTASAITSSTSFPVSRTSTSGSSATSFICPMRRAIGAKFNNGEGKAKFIISQIDRHDLAPGHYLMMTIRSHDQFNTTIYGLNDRYRGVYHGRRVVFLNADDIREAGLQQGQMVRSHPAISKARSAPRGISWWRLTQSRAGVRRPISPRATCSCRSNSSADRSNTPTSKSIIITRRTLRRTRTHAAAAEIHAALRETASADKPDAILKAWRILNTIAPSRTEFTSRMRGQYSATKLTRGIAGT